MDVRFGLWRKLSAKELMLLLEKTLESPLDCKEIQPVHPKGDQSWVFIGRADVEAETPILWPPDAKSWFIGKDPDARRDWKQEEKGTTKDEMAGWHHWLNGHEFEWTPGVGDGQGGLACCDSWGPQRVRHDWATELNWSLTFSSSTWINCTRINSVSRSIWGGPSGSQAGWSLLRWDPWVHPASIRFPLTPLYFKVSSLHFFCKTVSPAHWKIIVSIFITIRYNGLGSKSKTTQETMVTATERLVGSHRRMDNWLWTSYTQEYTDILPCPPAISSHHLKALKSFP